MKLVLDQLKKNTRKIEMEKLLVIYNFNTLEISLSICYYIVKHNNYIVTH